MLTIRKFIESLGGPPNVLVYVIERTKVENLKQINELSLGYTKPVSGYLLFYFRHILYLVTNNGFMILLILDNLRYFPECQGRYFLWEHSRASTRAL